MFLLKNIPASLGWNTGVEGKITDLNKLAHYLGKPSVT